MTSLITRREMVSQVGASGVALIGSRTLAQPRHPLAAFKPGQLWLDTSGMPIQAHGASIQQIGDTFYWYGENKERTLPGSGIWTWGIRAYASLDLYNWDDLGLIIPPNLTDARSTLNPRSSMLDRPHIIFNAHTNKYVCWVKIMEKDGRQTRTVLTADKITGPYNVVQIGLQPNGMNAGDFDLVISPADGKAYQYYERVHSEMICADLTADYTGVTGYYSTHLPRHGAGQVREGPAYFTRNGKHYLITSGTTGYHPNPSMVAVAETYHGPWTMIGDLHPSDRSRTSFNAQISSVFKHPAKKDLYIALADRWVVDLPKIAGPGYETGEAYRRVLDTMQKIESGGPVRSAADAQSRITPRERAYLDATFLTGVNTSRAAYVWLPVRFEGDRPYIEWRSKWTLDEFS